MACKITTKKNFMQNILVKLMNITCSFRTMAYK